MFKTTVAACALLVFASAANAADPVATAPIPPAAPLQPSETGRAATLTQQQREDAVMRLNWVKPGTYQLPQSNSTVALPEGYMMVTGADADRFETLAGNPPVGDSYEAVVLDTKLDQIVFQCFNEGYVSIDDWSTVDAAAMLDEIRTNTEEANIERRHQGFDELHVVGWLQQPTLDRTTATGYWAIESVAGDSRRIVNAVALRLSRDGYEKLIWVTDKADYQPVGGRLDVMLRAHSFEQGHQYADHISTDRIAGYGIAALVAATVGAKVAKVAAVGAGGAAVVKTGVFAALGKFIVFIFVGIAAFARRIGRGIKRLFQSSPRA